MAVLRRHANKHSVLVGPKPPRKRGRPRSFDTGVAVERAMRLFWRKGYGSTSLSDLTRAMRIKRPSLYAAFGNKEALFRTTLTRYGAGPAIYQQECLSEPTSR